MVMHLTDRPVHLLKRAALSSLLVGTLILGIKFAAYFITGSAALFSDAAESVVNVITAAFALYSVRVVIKPADECHPYGHGKIEFLSAAVEGGSIIVAALWIIYKAVQDLIKGPDIHQLDIGVWLAGGAAAINALLGWYLIKTGKKERSLIIEADGKHVMTDVATSLGVVVGLIVVVFTKWYFLDAVLAILVAVNIVVTGWRLLKQAMAGMMDAAVSEDEMLIKEILSSPPYKEVCSYHKMRHRKSGNFHFVDFHLIFPREMTIEHAHAIATAVEAQVATTLGDSSVMAHIEPCRRKDCPNCRDRPPLAKK